MSLAKASVWTAASTLKKLVPDCWSSSCWLSHSARRASGWRAISASWSRFSACWPGREYLTASPNTWLSIMMMPKNCARLWERPRPWSWDFPRCWPLCFYWRRHRLARGCLDTQYQGLVRLVALVQMGIAWANLLLALMKGFRDAAGNALALILKRHRCDCLLFLLSSGWL